MGLPSQPSGRFNGLYTGASSSSSSPFLVPSPCADCGSWANPNSSSRSSASRSSAVRVCCFSACRTVAFTTLDIRSHTALTRYSFHATESGSSPLAAASNFLFLLLPVSLAFRLAGMSSGFLPRTLQSLFARSCKVPPHFKPSASSASFRRSIPRASNSPAVLNMPKRSGCAAEPLVALVSSLSLGVSSDAGAPAFMSSIILFQSLSGFVRWKKSARYVHRLSK
mmetsp:Transcript_59684/g.104973  ORF Transcript_59684/g.104973 Transcript_59684/m.104973 type:complete len:224 (-) Transcript_59684:520-1191(-)